MTYEVRQGDCREVMATLDAGSVDAIVTDPPYGLAFMGKAWDHGVPGVEFWAEALRVAKPGAHLVAFGGTRTYHRLACAIEDSGWEIRDGLMWLYGSGFPKSLDVSKAVDKHLGAKRARDVVPEKRSKLHGDRPWMNDPDHRFESKEPVTAAAAAAALQGLGTALKPAWEPIILARKPLAGTVAANVLRHGTGALNVDGCRIGTEQTITLRNGDSGGEKYGRDERKGVRLNPPGRWPANVALDEEAAALLDAQSGTLQSGTAVGGLHRAGHGSYGGGFVGGRTEGDVCFGDSGGASRFFYTSKASSGERHYAGRNAHPTVKPVDLMQWLVRLVTPKGGLVLDPFTGSGSTGVAALAEGARFLGIELDPEHVTTARRRIGGPLFAEQPA